MIGDWMKFSAVRPQHLKDKGRQRRRRPGLQGDVIELLARSAGWMLICLGILHGAGLAYLPLDAR